MRISDNCKFSVLIKSKKIKCIYLGIYYEVYAQMYTLRGLCPEYWLVECTVSLNTASSGEHVAVLSVYVATVSSLRAHVTVAATVNTRPIIGKYYNKSIASYT